MPYVHAEDRRRQLVEAAVRVLEREGVRGLTTRRVADEAGAPLASIHYVFATKDDLVEAAIAALLEQLAAPILARVRPEEGIAAAIRSLLAGYWEYVKNDPNGEFVIAELTMAIDDERSRRFARAEYARYRAMALGALQAAATATGEQTAIPLEQLARLLVACTDGVLLQFSLEGDRQAAEADLRALADSLVTLISPGGGRSVRRAGSGRVGRAAAGRAGEKVPPGVIRPAS
jgi:AcrR family transcriptional regulator